MHVSLGLSISSCIAFRMRQFLSVTSGSRQRNNLFVSDTDFEPPAPESPSDSQESFQTWSSKLFEIFSNRLLPEKHRSTFDFLYTSDCVYTHCVTGSRPTLDSCSLLEQRKWITIEESWNAKPISTCNSTVAAEYISVRLLGSTISGCRPTKHDNL